MQKTLTGYAKNAIPSQRYKFMETQNIIKELAPLKRKLSTAVEHANSLEIKNQEGLIKATDFLGTVKKLGKEVTLLKKLYTDPAQQIIKVARAMFGPAEASHKEAEDIIKSKIVAYQMELQKKADIKVEKIIDKMDNGEIDGEQASAKIEAVTPKTMVEANNGAVQFRTVKEVLIKDETMLPREYLVPDLDKIRKVVLAGVVIPGVEVVEKQIVAGLTKRY